MRKNLLMVIFMCLFHFVGGAQSAQNIKERKIEQLSSIIRDLRPGKYSMKRTIINYDKQGKEVLLTETDSAGTLLHLEQHEYNSEGKEVMYRELGKDSVEKIKIVRTFDKWNNELSECKYEKGELKEKSQSKYNASGDKIEELTLGVDDKVIKKVVFEYDALGMISKRTTYNAEGQITFIKEYSYKRR